MKIGEERTNMSIQYQNIFSNRIGGKHFAKEATLFKFEKIKKAKRQAIMKNPSIPLIDLGVGEPDWMAEDAGRYIRLSVTYTATKDQENEVMNELKELKERLTSIPFIW
jgi:LL-diaminopimelate aminotransferase